MRSEGQSMEREKGCVAMKGLDLLDTIGGIDKKYINEVLDEEMEGDGQKGKRKKPLSLMYKKRLNRTKRFGRGLQSAAAVFAAITAAVFVTAGCVEAATGGLISNAIKGFFGWNTNTKEIVTEAKKDILRNMIYAPDVIWMDEELLIFATDRGVLLYDRGTHQIRTIDLQQTEGIYLNASAGEIHTHLFYEDGTLYLLNEKNGEQYGKYYGYPLDSLEECAWESEEKSGWKALYLKWEELDENYVDTFQTFVEIGLGEEKRSPNDQGIYSERSYRYRDEKGSNYLVYLTVPTDKEGQGSPLDKNFILNLYCEENGEIKTEEIWLEDLWEEEVQSLEEGSISEEGSAKDDARDKKDPVEGKHQGLPRFIYTGSDPAMPVICDYMIHYCDLNYLHSGEYVCIPEFVVVNETEKDGFLYVFGNFYIESYYRNGNTMFSESGGAYIARFQLKVNETGEYGIVDVVTAPDGADYLEGIKDFTEGFEGVYESFLGMMPQRLQESRLAFMRMYEEQNHLGIEYIRDYGWEPIPLYSSELK